MANHISLRGFVSSEIEMITTPTGLVIGKFRMGSNTRQLDPVTHQWVDGPNNWFRVTAFRALASNTMVSIHKGDRILIIGKLKVTQYLSKEGARQSGVEIEAESIGPDLQFGIASYKRMTGARPAGEAGESLVSTQGGGTSSTILDEGEYPADEPQDPNSQGDDDDYDEEEAAAALNDGQGTPAAEDDGLQNGERADAETGEILVSADPY